jgi:catechol 2,3-dioxygenase-like lactoylglutathione lyase family enzyme
MIDLTKPVTEAQNCHRIAVAVEDLKVATDWFQEVLGATLLPVEEQAGGAIDAEQDGGLMTILWLKNVPIVGLASTDPNGAIGRYLARNGPGIHSLAWEIPDMWTTENLLRANGMQIVGTDIPGRHFFVHPRQTRGLLLEYTDDKLPGDPRLGAPDPGGNGVLGVRSVAWVTSIVDDVTACVELLRYTFSALPAPSPSLPAGPAEEVVEVQIGDMPMRLVKPVSDDSIYGGAAPEGWGRFHSLALTVDDFDHLDDRLSVAGIGTVGRDDISVWTDPEDTMGIRLQLLDAAALSRN